MPRTEFKKKITKKKGVTIAEPTDIKFIHISSHGTRDSLDLPLIAQKEKKAKATDLANALSGLKGSGVKAIVFSCCQTGQNRDLAEEILKKTWIKEKRSKEKLDKYAEVCIIDTSQTKENNLYGKEDEFLLNRDPG